ncbi:MAG: hypothetical protein AAGA77_01310 [Bacteroidota bacterium]
MKKTLTFILLTCASMVFFACGDDKKCLICEGSSEMVCEGDVDPSTGEEITLALLEISKDLANALGGDCRIE